MLSFHTTKKKKNKEEREEEEEEEENGISNNMRVEGRYEHAIDRRGDRLVSVSVSLYVVKYNKIAIMTGGKQSKFINIRYDT